MSAGLVATMFATMSAVSSVQFLPVDFASGVPSQPQFGRRFGIYAG